MSQHFNDKSAFFLNAAFQLTWMTIMYLINMTFRNGSMVDFGWPSGFTVMAVAYWLYGPGVWIHRALICSLYILCGCRFMLGWVRRGHLTREDHRWEHWRTHWANNGGFFSSRSVPFNFFCFYHCQSLTNLIFMSVPLHVAATSTSATLSPGEYAGLSLWIFGFLWENTADIQLKVWQRTHKGQGGVMRSGLWKYSRHPNYFGEFLLWVSYAVMAIGQASWMQSALLLCLPAVAYYYLVYFTGAWMAEQVSLRKRGAAYAQYQAETSMFFPMPPRKYTS